MSATVTDSRTKYWIEAVSETLDEHGVSATPEQITAIASDLMVCGEMEGQAFGYDSIPNPMVAELAKVKAELRREQDKVVCTNCGGRGRVIDECGTFTSNSECHKCRGEGYA